MTVMLQFYRLSAFPCDPSNISSYQVSLNLLSLTATVKKTSVSICGQDGSVIGGFTKKYSDNEIDPNKSSLWRSETALESEKNIENLMKCPNNKVGVIETFSLGIDDNTQQINKSKRVEKADEKENESNTMLSETRKSYSKSDIRVSHNSRSKIGTWETKIGPDGENLLIGTIKDEWVKYHSKICQIDGCKRNKEETNVVPAVNEISKDVKSKTEFLKGSMKKWNTTKYSKIKTKSEAENSKEGEESSNTQGVELRKKDQRLHVKRSGKTSLLRKADELMKKKYYSAKRERQSASKTAWYKKGVEDWNKDEGKQWKIDGREVSRKKKKDSRKFSKNSKIHTTLISSSDERLSPIYDLISSDYENSENIYLGNCTVYR